MWQRRPGAASIGGMVETADGWADPQKQFLAAAAASPVWLLLRRQGLPAASFPEVLPPVTASDVGFCQHQGGRNNYDNWTDFISSAMRYLSAKEH